MLAIDVFIFRLASAYINHLEWTVGASLSCIRNKKVHNVQRESEFLLFSCIVVDTLNPKFYTHTRFTGDIDRNLKEPPFKPYIDIVSNM